MGFIFKIVILIFCLLLIGIGFLYVSSDNILDFGKIKITSNSYKSITEPLPEGEFVLCSIEDKGCMLMYKGNLNG